MTAENPTLFAHTPSWPLTPEDCVMLPRHVIACQYAFAGVSLAGIQGQVAECGVHAGVNLVPLALAAQREHFRRRIYACDTWAGLPEDEPSAGPDSLRRGECRTDLAAFRARMQRCGVEDLIEPVVGRVEETLVPTGPMGAERFAFVFLDLDLEGSTRHAVQFFQDRMTRRGLLGFHDFRYHRCPGIERVVAELDRARWAHWGPIMGDTVFFRRR